MLSELENKVVSDEQGLQLTLGRKEFCLVRKNSTISQLLLLQSLKAMLQSPHNNQTKQPLWKQQWANEGNNSITMATGIATTL